MARWNRDAESIYEAQRASSGGPTMLNFHTSLSYTEKYMNGRLRRAAACGGLRRWPAAACGRLRRRLRPPFAMLPIATLPPATLPFATLPACGGLRPPDAPRRRPPASTVSSRSALSPPPRAEENCTLHL